MKLRLVTNEPMEQRIMETKAELTEKDIMLYANLRSVLSEIADRCAAIMCNTTNYSLCRSVRLSTR